MILIYSYQSFLVSEYCLIFMYLGVIESAKLSNKILCLFRLLLLLNGSRYKMKHDMIYVVQNQVRMLWYVSYNLQYGCDLNMCYDETILAWL